MTNRFHYHGTLEETALSEMFYTIFRHRVPGLIDISRDGITKRITINDGSVLHASSTDRGDRLGAYLYRTQKLNREDLERTMRQREVSRIKYGQILIEEGLLSPQDLYEAIRGQMESIVWSVFSWQEGEVSFRIGEFADPAIKIHLPMRQVILRGTKRVSDTKGLVARLGRKNTVLRPAYGIEDLIELALDADEYALLRMVDGRRNLYEICSGGPLALSENARLLYAFWVLRMIERAGDEATGDGSGSIKIRLDADKKIGTP